MKTQNAHDALVAAFLAKGNTVTRCETGADSGISAREWSQAVRGEITAVGASARAERDAEYRAHEMHDTATEARLNGHRVTGFDSRGNVYTDRGRY